MDEPEDSESASEELREPLIFEEVDEKYIHRITPAHQEALKRQTLKDANRSKSSLTKSMSTSMESDYFQYLSTPSLKRKLGDSDEDMKGTRVKPASQLQLECGHDKSRIDEWNSL